ncbi:Lrp/AsnC family transcriptional regulator [Umezawaea endophytica]|uniref:Lrp/AsnC family transcriptional regulator n=1 Tax=Umezawaea endophytica TaxID=1654476 RepID=A0A9X2VKB3_9PSEU|nr:Lrp/AsnC family transcriptional regulator [Umezawaea endophytica]MCS7477979.1 Lrp/AsnC family transcriptional regulator [Umezawaea endophytica]
MIDAMVRESVVLDDVDRGVLTALAVDGRASFARVGEVLGVSDRTVARRYARLCEANLVRLVGDVDARRLGGAEWIVRVRCEQGSAAQVAEALARRDDTRWVNLLSGGTEISASLRSWSATERDELILHRLQRTAPVVAVTAHSVLHVFGGGRQGLDGPGSLTPDQVAALRPVHVGDQATDLADTDRPLLRALALDGRATYPVLAAATGWSQSRVARRIDALRAAGLLSFDVDVDTELLGYRAEARLWASVPPAHLAETGATIAAHPEVAFCAATTGPTNLLISTVCRDSADLYRYLTDRLGGLPHVNAVETAPVIRTVKRVGSPLRTTRAR